MRIFRKKPTARRKSKSKGIDCKFSDLCSCESLYKSTLCQLCRWYFWVDSGCGYCRALPEPSLVAWCKDPCSLFSPTRKEYPWQSVQNAVRP